MSYCRWSTQGFRCDLYCYEDSRGGWTTHVASKKTVPDPPEELPMPSNKDGPEWEAWLANHKAIRDYLDVAERAPLGGPHDGATFNDPTLEAFRSRLLSLRQDGYRFPDSVLQEVDEEIADAERHTG